MNLVHFIWEAVFKQMGQSGSAVSLLRKWRGCLEPETNSDCNTVLSLSFCLSRSFRNDRYGIESMGIDGYPGGLDVRIRAWPMRGLDLHVCAIV
jgi:hypothetical protein